VAVVSGCDSSSPSQPLPESSSFVSDILSAQQAFQLPGVGAALIRSTGIEDAAVVGLRRLDGGDSLSLNDRFHLGSDTKSMIATVAGRLVEREEIGWLLDPRQVFPELVDSLHVGHEGTTLQDLLRHRGGIQSYTSGAEWQAIPNFPGDGMEQRRAFAVWMLQKEPATTPGSYVYSNAGYAIAASMLEQITGQDWQALLQAEIFQPLGLTTAGFGWPAREDSNQPWGHWVSGGRLEPHPPDDEYEIPEIMAPAGDVHMSVADFAKYVRIHLLGLQGQDGILKAETFAHLHDPVGSYALGWGVSTSGSDIISTHNGSAGTFYAIMSVSHSRDAAVVVVTNAGGTSAQQGSSMLVENLLRR
jgi:CubicO group peptidase (beta-lactamase class C family)